MLNKLYLYDTTLRDGAQMEGVNFSIQDKLKITQKLNDFGIDFIEGGWPGSNPKEKEFFQKAQKLNLKSELVAFSATCLKDKTPQTDSLLKTVLDSKTKWITVFGKTWDLHTMKVLKISQTKALSLIENTIKFLVKNKRKVIFDAEHFFDGFKSNPKFVLECLRAAERAGAWNLTLCDTNGGVLPSEIAQITEQVQKEINTPLGIHAHNDSGLAISNSLAAVAGGVSLVQGTVNGFGERTGNANLTTLIADLQLKLGYKLIPPTKLKELTNLSNFVFETANLRAHDNQPYVGKFAFTHKGGIHASAVAKVASSYQHVDPAAVGNISRTTISELSGKSNVVAVAKRLGFSLRPSAPQTRAVLKQVKELENQGFCFEAAEASFALLILRSGSKYKRLFEVMDYTVASSFATGRIAATVELKVGQTARQCAATGNGPVNALDTALRRCVAGFYPQVAHVELTDYKVRILDSMAATGAKTRVLIESTDSQESWTTVGCSANILEASWQALTDSLEYAIWRAAKR